MAPEAFPVLVADDDDISRKRLESVLHKRGYGVVSARDGREAWEALGRDGAPRLAILDWMMPHMDGAEICRRLRGENREPYVYVILLTGKDAKQDLILGLESGADDYLTKPFDAQELMVRLRTGRRIVELQDELISAREQMRFLAMHDRLTGVFNRAAIDDVLLREIARAQRGSTPVAVAMIDLDFFKKVNDTHGHTGGDAVLREAARRFKGALRVYDIIGRFGGEEFIAIFPNCDLDGGVAAAERLRCELAKTPIRFGDAEINVTCSLGVASGRASHELDASALVATADAALYDAKGSGRDRVVAGKLSIPEAETCRPRSASEAPRVAI